MTSDLQQFRNNLFDPANIKGAYIEAANLKKLIGGGLQDVKKVYEATHKVTELSRKVTKEASSTAASYVSAVKKGFSSVWEASGKDNSVWWAEFYDRPIADIKAAEAAALAAKEAGYDYQKAFDSFVTWQGSTTGVDTSYAEKVLLEAGTSVGEAWYAGLAAAKDTYGADATRDINEVATDIRLGYEKEWAIHSPSKVSFGLGHMWLQGLVNAYEYYGSDVVAQSNNLAGAVVETTRLMALAAADELSQDNQLVLTPILDMNTIDEEMRRINRTPYTMDTTVALAGGIVKSREEAQAQTVKQEYVFNQYNTSPKALNRAEIYRNTRNQFSMFEQAVTK